MFVDVRSNRGRSFVMVGLHSSRMFKRSFQEVRNFASDERSDPRVIASAEGGFEHFQQEPALLVEAVISRLDEIVAEGLGVNLWRPEGASAFSA